MPVKSNIVNTKKNNTLLKIFTLALVMVALPLTAFYIDKNIHDSPKNAAGPRNTISSQGEFPIDGEPIPIDPIEPPSVGPSVIITSPFPDSTVSGDVTISATGNYLSADGSYSIYIDGGKYRGCPGSDSRCDYIWKTSTFAPGPHRIKVLALDADRNPSITEIVVFLNAPETEVQSMPKFDNAKEGTKISFPTTFAWSTAANKYLVRVGTKQLPNKYYQQVVSKGVNKLTLKPTDIKTVIPEGQSLQVQLLTETGSLREKYWKISSYNYTYSKNQASEYQTVDKQWCAADTNNDSRINLLDLTYVSNHFTQNAPFTDNKYAKGDTNGDNKINILDLNFISQNLNKKVPAYSAGFSCP